MIKINDVSEFIALSFFFVVWFGYNLIAERKNQKQASLTSILFKHRKAWARQMFYNTNSNGEFIALGNLERTVAFFASTSILILAGLITLINASTNISQLLSNIPLLKDFTTLELQSRLLILIVIFIYIFFKCTWSMRQYGFAMSLIGVIPNDKRFNNNKKLNRKDIKLADSIAQMMQFAAVDFNLALRANYFALAFIADLIHPMALVLSTSLTAYILYSREFESDTLRKLKRKF